MKNNKKNTKILFFTPHADDIELGVPFTYLESLMLQNEVIEVVMTNNEYGTINDEFKGQRLRNIRDFELRNANKVFEFYSQNRVKVIKMGYIDGHLPLNRDSLIRVSNLIRKEKPKIIFAPDPWFAQDYHADHLNTGRLVYFSFKKLGINLPPIRVFYYYSTKTHYYIKCNLKDVRIIHEALKKHRSQYSPLQSKLIITFYNKLSVIRHYLETFISSEAFREQRFDDKSKPVPPKRFKEMSLRERIIYYIFSNITIWGSVKFYNLSPKELGLEIPYNNRDILKILDRRYKYKY